jgi:hypothetical protein
MKTWVIAFIILILTAFKAEGQTITQTYVDPCDQKVYVVIIPFGQNSTVAVIRGKSKMVTLADISSGAFQTWVNSIFATPCPQNDAIRLAQEAAPQQKPHQTLLQKQLQVLQVEQQVTPHQTQQVVLQVEQLVGLHHLPQVEPQHPQQLHHRQ